jgi:predicted DNA-binding protein (MmcQ/YjbR family)
MADADADADAETDRLKRLRAIALALPESTEKETWGHPTFRIRDKMFATCGNDAASCTFKADPSEREGLVADEERFFVPAYVGTKGWVGMRLDVAALDWDEVAELVTTSFCLIAPKTVAKQVRQP